VSQSSGPTTVALWATIRTGAVAVLGLVSAFTTAAQVDEPKIVLADSENASLFADQNPLGLLSGPFRIAS